MRKLMLLAQFLVCINASADCATYVNNEMHDRVSLISQTIFKLNITELSEPGITDDHRYYYVQYVPGDIDLKDTKWFVVAKQSGNDRCGILSANRISNSF